ncbi:MAG: sigma-54 interaction domain-containing protein, partial [Sporomusa sp.]
LKNIQRMEMSARKKNGEQGFVAKSTFDNIVGKSPAIRTAKDIAKRYSQTDAIILINGETGSGKELFAQSIHNYSSCRNGPFVAINCSTLSESLLESELFGYEDGAFTGAKKGGRPGLFEIAHNGTFFLDEIGEMPLQLQSKLLRVLQERCVMRIGGSKNIPVKVRIILATNRDLYAEVKANRFREDLYYRINVLNLRLPPLRERKEDISLIVQSMIRLIKVAGSKNPYLSSEVVASFKRYDWFGNVRELSNFVERLTALELNDIRTVNKMLDELIANNVSDIQPSPHEDSSHLTVAIGPIRDMENEIIKKLYEYYGGNKRKVESMLDMSSTTLWRRFKTMQ